ncbi:hypothetical protein WJX82_000802 [Trebouxia sp. C0006]
MQGFPDLLWEGSFPENTTAAPVVKAFCCHYSLSQEACQLYCSNLPMAQEDALLQVQSTGPVRLPATFTPTLAFHVTSVLLHLGGIASIVTALDNDRAVAEVAFITLGRIISGNSVVPEAAASIAELLSRLQAVRRGSKLLCQTLSGQENEQLKLSAIQAFGVELVLPPDHKRGQQDQLAEMLSTVLVLDKLSQQVLSGQVSHNSKEQSSDSHSPKSDENMARLKTSTDELAEQEMDPNPWLDPMMPSLLSMLRTKFRTLSRDLHVPEPAPRDRCNSNGLPKWQSRAVLSLWQLICDKSTLARNPHCRAAKDAGIFKCFHDAVRQAAEESSTWHTEVCVALTRTLLDSCLLAAVFPPAFAKGKQEEHKSTEGLNKALVHALAIALKNERCPPETACPGDDLQCYVSTCTHFMTGLTGRLKEKKGDVSQPPAPEASAGYSPADMPLYKQATAAMQRLFVLVDRLKAEVLDRPLQAARTKTPWPDTAPKVLSAVASQAKECIKTALGQLQELHKVEAWMAILAELQHEGWCEDKSAPACLKEDLVYLQKRRALPAKSIQAIYDCFFGLPVTEKHFPETLRTGCCLEHEPMSRRESSHQMRPVLNSLQDGTEQALLAACQSSGQTKPMSDPLHTSSVLPRDSPTTSRQGDRRIRQSGADGATNRCRISRELFYCPITLEIMSECICPVFSAGLNPTAVTLPPSPSASSTVKFVKGCLHHTSITRVNLGI